MYATGGGSFAAPVQYFFAVGANPISVGIGDLNQDSLPDVIAAVAGINRVDMLFNNGTTGPGGALSR